MSPRPRGQKLTGYPDLNLSPVNLAFFGLKSANTQGWFHFFGCIEGIYFVILRWLVFLAFHLFSTREVTSPHG